MTTYKELDYIESTGTQYIVSPVKFYGDNYKIECKFDNSDTPTDTTPFGYQNTDSGVQIMVVGFNNKNSTGTIFWNGTSTAHENRAKLNAMTKGLNELVIEANNGTLTYTLNGASPVSYETYTSFEPQTENMWIFGNNRQSIGGSHQLVTMKFYYLRVYQNNVLLYDLIPVLDFNNTPAMYDKVNDVLYYNQGTGDFLYQRKGYCCEVEYLESTGTQYVDTGYVPTMETGSKGVVEFVSFPQNDTYFLGCRSDTGNTRFWIGQAHGSVSTTPLLRAAIGMFTASTIETPIGDKKEFSFNYNGDHKAYWGSESYAITDYVSFTATRPLWVFAANNNGSIVAPSAVKIYSLQIYEGTDIVRDYIPVLDWEMTPCFYDKITGEKLYNQGTGQFLYGAKETEPSIRLRRKFNMLLASHKNPEYKPLKYLEGTGTGTYTSGQYIDTGLDYFADFEITAKQRESAGMKALGTTTYYCIERENATTNAWRFRNGESTFFTTSLLVTDLHTLKWKNGKVYGDGVELGSFAKTSNTGRMYLFAGSTPNDATRINRYPLQISSCRMWNPTTGELVRDYIPVLDKNGTPCMLDRVENKLYYNQGTGDFAYEEWDYTPVDYLESTGTQYIDTGFKANQDTKVEIALYNPTDFTISKPGSILFGARDTTTVATANSFTIIANMLNNTKMRYDYKSDNRPGTNLTIGKHVIVKDKENNYLDGELINSNLTATFAGSYPLFLFACNTGGTVTLPFTGNVYSCKIWDDNTLVRDFIPVIDETNTPALYDKCLNMLFYNAGTGNFEAHFVENGVDYKVVKNIIAEQVETSTNTKACPYIDTGLYPATNKKTRLKCKASLSVATTSYEHYLGGTNAGSRFVLGQAGGSSGSKFYFGLGTRNYWTTKNVDTDTHIFGLDWATETCSVDDTTWQIPSAGTSESFKPFLINARNTANNANANRPGGGTSYWWKFWEGKKLVYNGIPAVRVSDNKVGLFETVNRAFQTTAGTVEYTYTE